jgi:uncharacterized membrane protein
MPQVEQWLQQIGLFLALAIELVAALIIAAAIARAVYCSALAFFTDRTSPEEVRLSLGRWLALSLEFLVAADILRTAVAPSWEELGRLAAIIALRTALNFFLDREIERSAQRTKNEVSGP